MLFLQMKSNMDNKDHLHIHMMFLSVKISHSTPLYKTLQKIMWKYEVVNLK